MLQHTQVPPMYIQTIKKFLESAFQSQEICRKCAEFLKSKFSANSADIIKDMRQKRIFVENIFCLKDLSNTQNRYTRRAPNDLEYVRGVTEYGKCPETGKRQHPLSNSKTGQPGARNTL